MRMGCRYLAIAALLLSIGAAYFGAYRGGNRFLQAQPQFSCSAERGESSWTDISGEPLRFYSAGVISGQAAADPAKTAEFLAKEAEKGNAAAMLDLGVCYAAGWGVEKDARRALECFKGAESCASLQNASDYNEILNRVRCEGITNIGLCYAYGFGVEWDPIEAVQQWQLGSFGSAKAQRLLAMGYAEGFGVGQDLQEAADRLYLAAENGDETAKSELEKLNRRSGVYAIRQRQAPEDLRRRANAGGAEAQFQMGEYHAERVKNYHLGFEFDREAAAVWYELAADQGNNKALARLVGLFHHQNIRDKYLPAAAASEDAEVISALADYYRNKDVHKYERLKKRAADMGSAEAQYMTGYLFRCGRWFFPRDPLQASKYYRQAVNQGYCDACLALDLLDPSQYGVVQDRAQTADCYKKCAEQGDVRAQYLLGLCYANGDGTEKDALKAGHWFRQAARHSYVSREAAGLLRQAARGDVQAQSRIGILLYNNKGIHICESVFLDKVLAALWLRPAARAGNAEAQYYMGRSYCNRVPIEIDYNNAVKWYGLAARQEYAGAQRQLSRLYSDFYEGATEAQEQEKTAALERVLQAYLRSHPEAAAVYGRDIAKSDEAKAEFWRRRADENDAFSLNPMGTRYGVGNEAEKNEIQARFYYDKAVEQGGGTEPLDLWKNYFSGADREKERLAQTLDYCRQAAELGYNDAELVMGHYYFCGVGTERDYRRAVVWYRRALLGINRMERDSRMESYLMLLENMRYMYQNGHGVEKDLAQAEFWRDLAEEYKKSGAVEFY